MRAIFLSLGVMVLVASSVEAADGKLPLNDQEQTALRQILDIATKSGGLQIAPVTLHFLSKLDAMSRPEPPENPKAPKPPTEPKTEGKE